MPLKTLRDTIDVMFFSEKELFLQHV